MINDEISDAVFLKYKENIAETETLIMAVRASRERAERLSRSTRCSRVEKRYINKRSIMGPLSRPLTKKSS